MFGVVDRRGQRRRNFECLPLQGRVDLNVRLCAHGLAYFACHGVVVRRAKVIEPRRGHRLRSFAVDRISVHTSMLFLKNDGCAL